jgi:hypothetical protein
VLPSPGRCDASRALFILNRTSANVEQSRGVIGMRAVLFIAIGSLVLSCSQPFNMAPPDGSPSSGPDTGGQSGSAGNPGPIVGTAGGASGGLDAPQAGLDAGSPGSDPACAAGSHQCPGGGCVSSMSPDHCGVSCSPCPGVAGGSPTCDGTRCGASCPAGSKPCVDKCVPEATACDGKCPPNMNLCGGGLCVDSKSLSACGPTCMPCPTSPNGVTTCNGDTCELKCNGGYHSCGTTCAKNDDPMTCGMGCTPCSVPTGGKATCDGTRCASECPAGQTLCNGACIGKDKACDGGCPAGKHSCSGNCVSDTDTATCGMSCDPCPGTANGDARCGAEKKCGIDCRAGFHQCPNGCKADSSADSCGGSCSPCPVPSAKARATCNNGVCGFECTSGFKCDGTCQECCDPSQCPPHSNQTATCNAGKCGYVDNCKANVRCNPNADNDCRTFLSSCPGGPAAPSQCDPVNKGNGTACGSGSGAGTCSNGTCVSLCATVQCLNGGTCSGGQCSCNADLGFGGARCETDCTTNGCPSTRKICNNGKCEDCGAIGQHCCGDPANGNGHCASADIQCSGLGLGMCSHCGGVKGELCCSGMVQGALCGDGSICGPAHPPRGRPTCEDPPP